jgi:hypothetical protein
MLGTHRRTALTLRVAGYSYREIQQLPGVTYTWVDATSPTAAGRSGAPRPVCEPLSAVTGSDRL